jgi:hypothetical protein
MKNKIPVGHNKRKECLSDDSTHRPALLHSRERIVFLVFKRSVLIFLENFSVYL